MAASGFEVFQYVADALMADLTKGHHRIRRASEKEVEMRIRQRYPNASAVLVRQGTTSRQALYRLNRIP
jgi:hypothetical protein